MFSAEEGGVFQQKWIGTALAGASAGALSRVPCHPIDTCKARLQFQTFRPRSSCPYRTFGGIFRHTTRGEGLAGLYRGFGATMWGSVPAACLYFTVYEGCKSTIGDGPTFNPRNPVVHFLSGLSAEAVSCLLFVPIDVVKERVQTQHAINSSHLTRNYRGSVDAIASILRVDGMRGIYRGYGATLLSFGPFSALYFVFYEQFKAAGQGRFYFTCSTCILACWAQSMWRHLPAPAPTNLLHRTPQSVSPRFRRQERPAPLSFSHCWRRGRRVGIVIHECVGHCQTSLASPEGKRAPRQLEIYPQNWRRNLRQ